MYRSIFLLIFIFLVSTTLFGQEKPDFSGVWIIDKITSHPDAKLQTAVIRMTIEQNQTEIKFVTFTTPNGSLNISQSNRRAISYPFGKESLIEAETPSGKMPIKTKAELTNKGKLNLNSSESIKTAAGEVAIKIKEIFELSTDGRTMKINREIQNSAGVPITEISLARKQAEQTDNTPPSNPIYDIVDLKKQFPEGVLNSKAKHLENVSYPGTASATRVTGLVPVRIIFDEEGKVIFAQAIFGHPVLKGAAVESAMKCTFEPIEIAGKHIRVSGIILYNFSR